MKAGERWWPGFTKLPGARCLHLSVLEFISRQLYTLSSSFWEHDITHYFSSHVKSIMIVGLDLFYRVSLAEMLYGLSVRYKILFRN